MVLSFDLALLVHQGWSTVTVALALRHKSGRSTVTVVPRQMRSLDIWRLPTFTTSAHCLAEGIIRSNQANPQVKPATSLAYYVRIKKLTDGALPILLRPICVVRAQIREEIEMFCVLNDLPCCKKFQTTRVSTKSLCITQICLQNI